MLERFKVPLKDQVRVSEESLRRTVTEFFEKMGETSEDAAIAADTLVSSDLRGVESHGVSNMLRAYQIYYKKGGIKPQAAWRIVRETPGTANFDADQGLVIILGRKAMQTAIDKAKKVGIGAVTVYNSGHSGPLGHFALQAVQNNMIGLVLTAAGTQVVPTFASRGLIGTNPIACAAPTRNEAPFLFDAATCSVAGNKIELARRLKTKLEPGWIADSEGLPIMESIQVPERTPENPILLLPLGGTREQGSHKGFGFAMITEVLGGLLAGSVPGMLASAGEEGFMHKHHFAAYNIEAFTDIDTFKDNLDRTLKLIRETKPAKGHERVLYPGLIEHEEEQERRANGIPLHKEVIEWFGNMTNELEISKLEICSSLVSQKVKKSKGQKG